MMPVVHIDVHAPAWPRDGTARDREASESDERAGITFEIPQRQMTLQPRPSHFVAYLQRIPINPHEPVLQNCPRNNA